VLWTSSRTHPKKVGGSSRLLRPLWQWATRRDKLCIDESQASTIWLWLVSGVAVAVSPGNMFDAVDRLGVLRCTPWSLVACLMVVAMVSSFELALHLRVGA
jgi:hypothetical protein